MKIIAYRKLIGVGFLLVPVIFLTVTIVRGVKEYGLVPTFYAFALTAITAGCVLGGMHFLFDDK